MEVISLFLIIAAFLCWRWSFNTDDRLVATVRWCLAVFTLLMAVVVGLVALLS